MMMLFRCAGRAAPLSKVPMQVALQIRSAHNIFKQKKAGVALETAI